jgi:hypothetical protein
MPADWQRATIFGSRAIAMDIKQSELLLALGCIEVHALHSAQKEMIETVRTLIHDQGASGAVNPDATKLVKAFLTGLTRIATSERANELLSAQRVAVVGSDLCNACAVGVDDGNVVFVFQGLLKAVLFVLEFSDIVHALDSSVKSGAAPVIVMQADLAGIVSDAYAGLYYYISSAEPLNRPGEGLPASEKAGLMIRFSRVLWFLLMHEIGHIQLGHLGSSILGGKSHPPALVCSEDLNVSKLQEFEADLYVCETLKESEQYALLSYVLAPLDMFASFERNLGPPKDTHPMAVNRLQNILSARRSFLDSASIAAAEEMIMRDHLSIDPIRMIQRNYAPRATREEAPVAIRQLQTLYAALPLADEATAEELDRAKLWDYTVGYFWQIHRDPTTDQHPSA